MRLVLVGSIAVAAVVWVGCKSPVLPESDGLALAAGLSPVEIRDGRKVYLTKCARCHKFYDPAGYDDTDWRDWMAKMSSKSRLNGDQERILSRYLDAFRAGRKPDVGSPR
jgi:cytochrome c553